MEFRHQRKFTLHELKDILQEHFLTEIWWLEMEDKELLVMSKEEIPEKECLNK